MVGLSVYPLTGLLKKLSMNLREISGKCRPILWEQLTRFFQWIVSGSRTFSMLSLRNTTFSNLSEIISASWIAHAHTFLWIKDASKHFGNLFRQLRPIRHFFCLLKTKSSNPGNQTEASVCFAADVISESSSGLKMHPRGVARDSRKSSCFCWSCTVADDKETM